MAEVLLFHHAHGQTEGFHAFANDLRGAGHVVHTPDLYDGNTFAELDDGIAYAKQVGSTTCSSAASPLPRDCPWASCTPGSP